MRRWRLADGRTLIEAPSLGDVEFYRLGKDHQVDAVYRKETMITGGELHAVSFTVLDLRLMKRYTVDHGAGRPVDDRSRVELDALDLLPPAVEPTERRALEAVVAHSEGERAADAARRAQVERIAAGAAPALRDLVRRLAERVVFGEDEVARALLTSLASLASLRRTGSAPAALQAAGDALTLAARLAALDPEARRAEHPGLEESPALALIDALETTRRDLAARAEAGGRDAGAYREAAAVLRVAIYHLFVLVRPIGP